MTGVKLENGYFHAAHQPAGFAPVVRGIANSDAKVTIRQKRPHHLSKQRLSGAI